MTTEPESYRLDSYVTADDNPDLAAIRKLFTDQAPRSAVTEPEPDEPWEPWLVRCAVCDQGIVANKTATEVAGKFYCSTHVPVAKSPWDLAVESGRVVLGSQWQAPDGRRFTVAGMGGTGGTGASAHMIRDGSPAAMMLSPDGSAHPLHEWSCVRPTPDAPKVGDTLMWGEEPFVIKEWRWIASAAVGPYWRAYSEDSSEVPLDRFDAVLTPVARVVPVPPQPPQIHTRPDQVRCDETNDQGGRCMYVGLHGGHHEYEPVPVPAEPDQFADLDASFEEAWTEANRKRTRPGGKIVRTPEVPAEAFSLYEGTTATWVDFTLDADGRLVRVSGDGQ